MRVTQLCGLYADVGFSHVSLLTNSLNRILKTEINNGHRRRFLIIVRPFLRRNQTKGVFQWEINTFLGEKTNIF